MHVIEVANMEYGNKMDGRKKERKEGRKKESHTCAIGRKQAWKGVNKRHCSNARAVAGAFTLRPSKLKVPKIDRGVGGSCCNQGQMLTEGSTCDIAAVCTIHATKEDTLVGVILVMDRN